MIEKEMVLMNAMRTENNLDITEEQILNSLDSFIDKPIFTYIWVCFSV